MQQSLKDIQDQKKKEFLLKYGETIKNEKDTYIFTHAGMNCLVMRHEGHLNGYVNIPADHLLYEQGYGDWIDEDNTKKYTAEYSKVQKALKSISVHWWLTFADHQTRSGCRMKRIRLPAMIRHRTIQRRIRRPVFWVRKLPRRKWIPWRRVCHSRDQEAGYTDSRN